ncbi:hypothetical protein, partial [Nostoc sp. JL31]|uniref:hypothetical protein n=1 Tax=Nostoc sp. JL31 TaxID=2815395 RepID=UPI0026010907
GVVMPGLDTGIRYSTNRTSPLAYHHYPCHPTPVLSKAKTAPPLGKGRGWGGVNRMWGKHLSLS